jgi:hypothetical protein
MQYIFYYIINKIFLLQIKTEFIKDGKSGSLHNLQDSNEASFTSNIVDRLPENYMLEVRSYGPSNSKAIQVLLINLFICLLNFYLV